MNSTTEDRLRAALQAHAEDFTVSQDAWQQLAARTEGTSSRATGGRTTGIRTTGSRQARRLAQAKFAVPAAAAAAVVIVIVAATTITHGLAGSPAAGPRGTGGGQASVRSTSSPAPNLTLRLGQEQLALVPPSSAILTLPLGQGHGSGFFWYGYDSPEFWGYQVNPGLQFCDAVGSASGSSQTSCVPLSALHSADLASVTVGGGFAGASTGGTGAATAQTTYAGTVNGAATSVTAVLPDGHRYAGEVGSARGFPDKAWIVECPQVTGTQFVFRNASGRQIEDVGGTQAQIPAVQAPRSGAIAVLHYAGNTTGGSGVVLAYLAGGHVAFFLGQPWPVAVSPDAAAGLPAIAGMTDIVPTGSSPYPVVALGYAHANVARIVVHLPHGKQVTVDTFQAGWRGSSLRLWTAQLGTGLFNDKAGLPAGLPALTATAYDAAGHVLGQVRLGFSNFPI
jgi:hypothetical protein